MKKLTAGIFAGILTIVTVNAANAEIASGAYVRQQVKTVDDKIGTTTTATNEYATKDTVGANIDELDKQIKTNTGNITTLTSVVGATDNDGLRKDVADLKSNMGTNGSVADQIADALGDYKFGEGENDTVTSALAKKADKATSLAGYGIADAYTKTETDSAVSTAISGLTLGTVDGEAKGVFTTLTETGGKVGGTKSLIKDENVATDAAIAESKLAFDADSVNGSIKNLIKKAQDAADAAAEAAETAESNADTALSNALGTYEFGVDDNDTVTSALAKKQDKLGTTNVVTDGTGNVVTAVTAADGTVTVSTGNMMPAVPETQKATDGTLVLTAKVDNGNVTYAWEDIARATDENSGAGE